MFKVNSSNNGNIISIEYGTGGWRADIYVDVNNQFKFRLLTSNGSTDKYNSTTLINSSTWYYLVISFDKRVGTQNGYIAAWFGSGNTISQITPVNNDNTLTYTPVSTPNIIIGGYLVNDTGYLWHGEIANVRLTSKVLYPYTQNTITKPTSYYPINYGMIFSTSGTNTNINASGNLNINTGLTINP